MDNRIIKPAVPKIDREPVPSAAAILNQLESQPNSPHKINPYLRAVLQPTVTGLFIGAPFFPVHWTITQLQNRPAGISVLQFFKGMVPKVSANQSFYQSMWSSMRLNSKYVGKGVGYSCTTSFMKSVFTCQGPTVHKRIESDFGITYSKDVQDSAVQHQDQFVMNVQNKWLVTGGISSVLGTCEAMITSGTAARTTCAMLKREVTLSGFYTKLMFVPGINTRILHAGFGQFTFMGAGHITGTLRVYLPEEKYGSSAMVISSVYSGVIGGAIGTVFGNLYTHQLAAMKEMKPGTFKTAPLHQVGKHIFKNIGWRGFARGGIANMATTPFIYFVAHSINEWFDKIDGVKNPRCKSAYVSNSSLFFSNNRQQKPPSSQECAKRPKGP